MSKASRLREIFAQNLRDKRESLGLTQSQLAKKAKVSGRYISILETQGKNVTLDTIDDFAKAMGVDAIELLVDPLTLRRLQNASLDFAITTLREAKINLGQD
jgi:transcriptional regulator with XRE-family HTH domain